jgi:hypothetical protein
VAPSISNVAVTVAVGPGIVTHEYAHYLACRLTGVTVLSPPALRPFADDAVLEHEPVDSFGADFPIAVAPFAVNSVLAFAAFWAWHGSTAPLGWLWLWLGICFGFTALPSDADTDTLFSTAGRLPAGLRQCGYLLAAPVWAATRSMLLAGVLAFLWTSVLFAQSAAI